MSLLSKIKLVLEVYRYAATNYRSEISLRQHLHISAFTRLTVFLTPRLPKEITWPFADSVDQDQTAQTVQSDLDLHCPTWRYFCPKNKFERLLFWILIIGFDIRSTFEA